jgi:hypothetical protein
MKRLAFGLPAAVVVAGLVLASARGSTEEGKPIAVLRELSPWAARSGQPTFVLYADGSVIWRKGLVDPDAPYLTVRLTGKEFERLRKDLAPTDSFMKLKSFYDLTPNVTDQPAAEIYLAQEGRAKLVTVVGIKPNGYTSPAFAVLPTDRRADSIPAEFHRLYETMSAFESAGATTWKPKYLQVRVWPFDHAKDASLPWPASWPDLKDARTEQQDQIYLLYFPAELEESLKKFLAERGSTRPALINGRKWSVTYRYVLPGMSVWEEAAARQQPSK